jgi:addiction module HigA family antidote
MRAVGASGSRRSPTTLAIKYRTDLAIQPGEHLREELGARGLTQVELARRMDRPAQLVSDICRERTGISPQTALDLEAALGIEAEVWLGLQQDCDLTRARLARRKDVPATA